MKLTSTVIMATFNGSAFIYDQLTSILEQTSSVAKVIIRDDGSTDDTSKIVEEFIDNHGLYQTWDFQINDDHRGWRKNFMDMLAKIETDLVFFSDQDDVWYSDKVMTLVKAFSTEATNTSPQLNLFLISLALSPNSSFTSEKVSLALPAAC